MSKVEHCPMCGHELESDFELSLATYDHLDKIPPHVWKPVLYADARAHLDADCQADELSTVDLVRRLLGFELETEAKAHLAFSLICKALFAGIKAGQFAGYFHKGEPQPGKGPMQSRMVRPYLWHAKK